MQYKLSILILIILSIQIQAIEQTNNIRIHSTEETTTFLLYTKSNFQMQILEGIYVKISNNNLNYFSIQLNPYIYYIKINNKGKNFEISSDSELTYLQLPTVNEVEKDYSEIKDKLKQLFQKKEFENDKTIKTTFNELKIINSDDSKTYYNELFMYLKQINYRLENNIPLIIDNNIEMEQLIYKIFDKPVYLLVSEDKPEINYFENLPFEEHAFVGKYIIQIQNNKHIKYILKRVPLGLELQLKINLTDYINQNGILNFKQLKNNLLITKLSESEKYSVRSSKSHNKIVIPIIITNVGKMNNLEKEIGDSPTFNTNQYSKFYQMKYYEPTNNNNEQQIKQNSCINKARKIIKFASSFIEQIPYDKYETGTFISTNGEQLTLRQDCSGFVNSVLNKFDIEGIKNDITETMKNRLKNEKVWKIINLTKEQNEGKFNGNFTDEYIDKNLLPGDMILYGDYTVSKGRKTRIRSKKKWIGHVAIYAGNIGSEICSKCTNKFGNNNKYMSIDESGVLGGTFNNEGNACKAEPKGNVCWRDINAHDSTKLYIITTIPDCISLKG